MYCEESDLMKVYPRFILVVSVYGSSYEWPSLGGTLSESYIIIVCSMGLNRQGITVELRKCRSKVNAKVPTVFLPAPFPTLQHNGDVGGMELKA